MPHMYPPVWSSTILFALTDAGIASAIDLSNGELLWKERLDGNFFASPVICGDIIYVPSTDGKIFTMKANRKSLKQLGISNLNDTAHNTPAISEQGIFFRTYSKLIHLKAKS